MAYLCDRCGKGKIVVSQRRHKKGIAGGQWKFRAPQTKRVVFPNLHPYSGVLNGKKGKWRLCTKCLRIVKKGIKANPEV